MNIGGSISLMLQNLDVNEQKSHGIDDNNYTTDITILKISFRY